MHQQLTNHEELAKQWLTYHGMKHTPFHINRTKKHLTPELLERLLNERGVNSIPQIVSRLDAFFKQIN
jgi:arsenate reductase-like glutaredoxin family protein